MDRELLPEGWKLVTLGEVCFFENGDRGENYPSKSVQTVSGIPFINAGHLTDSGIDFSDMNYIPKERFEILKKGKIRKEDILFCLRGSLGKVASVENLDEGVIASSLVIVRSGSLVLNKFLLSYFKSNLCSQMIEQFRNGAAQPNLSAASLKKFYCPLPPLDEQKRIVAILDEAFEGIDQAIRNTEKNLANARELFDSYLNKIFTQKGNGWIEKTLGEVCDFLNGFAFKSDDVVKDSDVQLIRMGNLYQNILDIERNPVFYPNEFKEKFSRYALSEGDLIMSLTGTVDKEDYGYTVEVPKIEKTLLLNQRIAKFINIDSDYVDKNFFLYLLRSSSFLSALYKSSRGVRQANLSS